LAHSGWSITDRFTTYLGCTGIVALVVVAFPIVVFFGLAFGIVPGILLGLTPSLFLYSLPWWITRALIIEASPLMGLSPISDLGRMLLRRAAGALAVFVLAVPAVLVPYSTNAPIERAVAMLRADDVEAVGPVDLGSVVAILLPRDYYDPQNEGPYCETLCQRLLYNGAASRVVMVRTPLLGQTSAIAHPISTYRIEHRDQCPEPALSRNQIIWPGDLRIAVPERRVRARITAGECLVRDIGSLDGVSSTITFTPLKKGVSIFSHPWTLQLDTITANRIEITKADGTTVYRRTEVKTGPLTVPLLIETRAGLLTTVTYVGWARSERIFAPIGPQGRDVLPGLLGTAARPPDAPAPK
jgi:hypothetical protein